MCGPITLHDTTAPDNELIEHLLDLAFGSGRQMPIAAQHF